MSFFTERGYAHRPSLLEGPNYYTWRSRMRAFLKSIDERVWSTIVDGWTALVIDENEVSRPKMVASWTVDELTILNYNSKVIHALFNAVNVNQMKVIANCERSKDAWDRLQVKNEGTSAVKRNRLRRLLIDFENLNMHDDETITALYGRVCGISNECFALAKTYSNIGLVRKVLCSLPQRFMSKVTTIEECCDMDVMDIDELIGFLQTYELNLKRWDKQKPSKDLALKHEQKKALFEKIVVLTTKLTEAKAIIDKLNVGSLKLDEVLGQEKSFGDRYGLGFSPGTSTSNSSAWTFVKATKTPTEDVVVRQATKKKVLENHNLFSNVNHNANNGFSSKRTWKPKTDVNCFVSHTSLLAFQNDLWYLDSGCSRHVIGNKSLLTELESVDSGHVTYDDGKKGKILGKGSIVLPDFSILKDVLLIDGLKTNLISISQICDKIL
ncbi:uncharacterized protein LOC116111402 [Pistacia vera]|uniref:uncharacterized protein LOC116111402 n=1 Tax=Pistacia vera TaxID=55513 RepID=UPI001262BF6A|nr:uncharacterized protein LOC116111402 [Pistacia vera]